MQKKFCNTCQMLKPLSAFHKCRTKSCGVQNICKPFKRKQNEDWARRNPAKAKRKARIWRLKSVFGLTPEQYEILFKKQNGLCALCSRPAECIDHCHKTGKVRGLLCQLHNRGLGHFQDDPRMLERAARYLKNNG